MSGTALPTIYWPAILDRACYPARMSAVKTRIMYIQRGWGPGRIGRVRVSKSGRTLFYGDLELTSIGGRGGLKTNYAGSNGDEYWVSGPRKDGQDTLTPGLVEIDDDVRDEYWRLIRGLPESAMVASFRSLGVHAKHATR